MGEKAIAPGLRTGLSLLESGVVVTVLLDMSANWLPLLTVVASESYDSLPLPVELASESCFLCLA